MTATKPKPPRVIVKTYRSVPIPLVVLAYGAEYRIDSIDYVLADDATASPQPKRKRKAGKR